jgi:PIF1-like helicase
MLGLIDDCRYRLHIQYGISNPHDEQVQSVALSDINNILQQVGKSLDDGNLPRPRIDINNITGIPCIIAEERENNLELMHLWAEGYALAMVKQRTILDTICVAVELSHGALFFIDGSGGTGKTFVENLQLTWVPVNCRIALAVASSGITATLLYNGCMSRSLFHIPIDVQRESVCTVPAHSALAQIFRFMALIVWDEVSSQHQYGFKAVNRMLQDIRKSNQWFGGIPIVFEGKTGINAIVNKHR